MQRTTELLKLRGEVTRFENMPKLKRKNDPTEIDGKSLADKGKST